MNDSIAALTEEVRYPADKARGSNRKYDEL
jgi:hypothetical protein